MPYSYMLDSCQEYQILADKASPRGHVGTRTNQGSRIDYITEKPYLQQPAGGAQSTDFGFSVKVFLKVNCDCEANIHVFVVVCLGWGSVAGHGVCDRERDGIGRGPRPGMGLPTGEVDGTAHKVQGRIPTSQTRYGKYRSILTTLTLIG